MSANGGATDTIHGYCATRDVYIGRRRRDPAVSLQYRRHSPTGFMWSYGGSGPAQLALALLLEVTTPEEALELYQAFKWDVIAPLPHGDFELPLDQVHAWVRKQRATQQTKQREAENEAEPAA